MNDPKTVLLFLNDFAGGGSERFFFVEDGVIAEVQAENVVEAKGELICHDYWLIAPALYRKTGSLPKLITDVEELRIATSGRREDREGRERVDVWRDIESTNEHAVISQYRNIIFKAAEFDEAVFLLIASKLLSLYEEMVIKAIEAGEWQRYTEIERPITDYLMRCACQGLAIDAVALRKHKGEIDFLYYMALKEFSAKFDVPLEVPSDEDVMDYLIPKGYDFSGVGVEYVLSFLPMHDGYSEKLQELRKISNSRFALNNIPFSQTRIYPMVDSFGSITSRIYYKDPSLQSLSKRHRNILAPDFGMVLSYVDFGQYEAGIMGALSQDAELLSQFHAGDLYALLARELFGSEESRKYAKRLFLSYAYGMKRRNLIDAAVNLGSQREVAKEFFSKFQRFEAWKKEICENFRLSGRIGTVLGNYLVRDDSSELTEKEKRSAVSQVVQGTASLIFKKALLRLSEIPSIQLKVPMHDAVLFQHPKDFDPQVVATLFAEVMTAHFGGQVIGKASIANFLVDHTHGSPNGLN